GCAGEGTPHAGAARYLIAEDSSHRCPPHPLSLGSLRSPRERALSLRGRGGVWWGACANNSGLPCAGKPRRLAQHVGAGAEGAEKARGVRDRGVEERQRTRDAVDRDQRLLAARRVFGGRLAGVRGAGGVDEVVGELEGEAERGAVFGERGALRRRAAAE